jgi:hypothetical protein
MDGSQGVGAVCQVSLHARALAGGFLPCFGFDVLLVTIKFGVFGLCGFLPVLSIE